MPDQLLQTPSGTLRVGELVVTKCSEGGIFSQTYLQGKIFNTTPHTWETLFVDVKATTRDGRSYTFDALHLTDFKPGQAIAIGRDKCGISISYLPANLASWGFYFGVGKINTHYTLELTRPIASSALLFDDAIIAAEFLPSARALNFAIKNKSGSVLRIDWNQAAFVDWTGRSHSVTHQGVKFADKGATTPPSVIPPGARIEDLVIPADNITMGSRDWIIADLLPSGPESRELLGKDFTVYLPIVLDGKTSDYSFTFKVLKIEY